MPEAVAAPAQKFRLTRRGFLIGLANSGVGLAFGVRFGGAVFAQEPIDDLAPIEVDIEFDEDPRLWFKVLADNTVRIIIPKSEMGQGVHTSMGQICADELGASWDQVRIVQGGTTLGAPDTFGTVGSFSVQSSYTPMRRAAACMRQMLLEEAARKLDTPVGRLSVANGRVQSVADPYKALSFGEIVAGVTQWTEPANEPVLKDPAEFTLIGTSVPRCDILPKLRGEPVYGYDQSREGMLYGAVARPPALSAKMTSAAAGRAAGMPGVAQVVIDESIGFAGVVARTREQAWKAVKALDIRWETGPAWNLDEIETMLDVSDSAGRVAQNEGDALAAIGSEPTRVAEYRTPPCMHAPLEPPAALADVRDGRVDIIASTQAPLALQEVVAGALDIPREQVSVTPAYLGGGFGRKDGAGVAPEAAILSRAVGRPVHVGWAREEDMQHSYYRPPTRHRLKARIENGTIAALVHNVASGDVLFRGVPEAARPGMPIDVGARVEADIVYSGIRNRRISILSRPLPLPTGSWRGLGGLANSFALESFMDELAHEAGADPLEFRLRHLGETPIEKRRAATLEALAERVNYGRTLTDGHAIGIASVGSLRSVVAMCAEISLDSRNAIAVHRVTQVIDAGLIVNPDGARAQVEGAITMGLSATLIEELSLENGVIGSTNFHQYPLLRMAQAPDIDVAFIGNGPPEGLGEPPLYPVAAAIANALYNLMGKRIRELPLTPQKISRA
jgi:isoquinoline 1-oxidoreductase beta subunit